MATDKNGKELKVGDRVWLCAEIMSIDEEWLDIDAGDEDYVAYASVEASKVLLLSSSVFDKLPHPSDEPPLNTDDMMGAPRHSVDRKPI